MLDSYDLDPVGTLAGALSLIFGVEGLTWNQLIERAEFTDRKSTDLQSQRTAALDDLLTYLVENRSL